MGRCYCEGGPGREGNIVKVNLMEQTMIALIKSATNVTVLADYRDAVLAGDKREFNEFAGKPNAFSYVVLEQMHAAIDPDAFRFPRLSLRLELALLELITDLVSARRVDTWDLCTEAIVEYCSARSNAWAQELAKLSTKLPQ